MKRLDGRSGRIVRLGAMIVALFIGQHAMAEGTRAGTTISNTATVDYFVGGVDQADITSDPTTATFVVDRRVDFTLTRVSDGDLVTITPVDTDVWVDFLLTNTSNSDLDFELSLAQSANGDTVDSGTDSTDMATIDWAVVTTTDALPARNGEQFVDDLAADASVRIRVYGDAAATMLNGQVAGAELTATARDPAGSSGSITNLTYGGANGDLTIENVAANGSGVDGVEVTADGWIVQAASLTVAKSYSVIDGDLGSGLPIPGARIRYEIVVTNAAGGSPATGIEISDTLNTNLTFLTDALGSDYADIFVDDGTTSEECTADTAVADTDGCSLDGADLVVGNANRPITINAGESYTVRFDVRVNDPAITVP